MANELILIKLGGSVITNKRKPQSYNQKHTQQLAMEIANALDAAPSLRILIGHGSGSFGHVAAKLHDTITGVKTSVQWQGFAEVAAAAAELNHLVTQDLRHAGLPVWSIQPSASAKCENGQLLDMALHPIRSALDNGLMPLVYGDVALDSKRGGTIISTETIMSYLVAHMQVDRIILIGEVDGVLDQDGSVISKITPQNFSEYQHVLRGSGGTDVTGGMLSKVNDMLKIIEQHPSLTIRIINGQTPNLLFQTLVEETQAGTLICSD